MKTSGMWRGVALGWGLVVVAGLAAVPGCGEGDGNPARESISAPRGGSAAGVGSAGAGGVAEAKPSTPTKPMPRAARGGTVN